MTPAVVVGGWLGAGKTTLVNHLLRHGGGRRIAVLVNDFGELAIDAALIEGADGEVLALTGGCVCCSFGADLVGGLRRVMARDPGPEVLLIECSGVGLPAAVARTARLAPGLVVEGLVVVVDAEQVRRLAGDRYIGETVLEQLREADLLIVNKHDLLAAAEAEAVDRWLADVAPRAARVATVRGELPAEIVLGLHGPGRPRATAQPLPEAAGCRSAAWALSAPVDLPALAAALTAPGAGVLRAKGLLTGADGHRVVLQQVGAQLRLEAVPDSAAGVTDRLLVIGSGDLERFAPAAFAAQAAT